MRSNTWLWDMRGNAYSQEGEDGVIAAALDVLPARSRLVVEFGAHDGLTNSNSRRLILDDIRVQEDNLGQVAFKLFHAAMWQKHPYRLDPLGTAHSVASDLGVNGWVRNSEDGHVEITAEAEEDILLYFLKQLKESFASSIREARVDWRPASGAFKDFTITR